MKKLYFLIFISAIFFGCATTTKVTNLTPAYLTLKPLTQVFKAPDYQETKYKTFSVFPSSLINVNSEIKGEILEKQMLFVLRNYFELKGYKFVTLDQTPDLLVTIDGSAPYKETYVPPQTVTVPYWVPGQTITSFGTSTGSFNINTYRQYSAQGWGNWTGSYTSSTYIPGYMTTQTYTRPGYTKGAYYPSIVVSAYDAETLNNVWLGLGVGTSLTHDFRVSSQFVLVDLMGQFPKCVYAYENYPPGSGMVGFKLFVMTNDGNNYFPTIFEIKEDSYTKKADLKVYDMILAVDGISTLNKSVKDIKALIRGEAGTEILFTIWRTGQKFDVRVKRSQKQ